MKNTIKNIMLGLCAIAALNAVTVSAKSSKNASSTQTASGTQSSSDNASAPATNNASQAK